MMSAAEDAGDVTADRQGTMNDAVKWKHAAAEQKDNDGDGSDGATDQPRHRNQLAHRHEQKCHQKDTRNRPDPHPAHLRSSDCDVGCATRLLLR